MEYRSVEVKLMCAKDLKNVNIFSKMDVYVMGSVSGDPNRVQRTPVHKGGGTNPSWNHWFRFAVDESAVKLNLLGLIFRIMSDRTLGDREIGRAYVPLKELVDAASAGKDEKSGEISAEERPMTYRVQTPSGKFKGHLEFSYKIGEKFTQNVNRKLDEPVMAYPAWAGSGPGTSSYPSQRVQAPYSTQGHGYGYGYGYQTQQPGPLPNPQAGYGYGYPGQGQGGYGHSGQLQQPKRGSGFGMGTAMGVGAGLLGGFLLGEMVEDVAEAVAYDDMMDDGMFDF